ncbi:Uncharacterized conserved protein, contains FIST_N domain [Lishizhenia tianjinensis]|uniref:Uncharacterized conserved protein, contains FIST_N domain n=1 Tax=Lishizhenia tianjinensis TaxID=477690 RepID=A0A1I7BPC2_9FLAO|nr:FIST N-terminal domain-containing protein [Lishizhenia tianjinensis]SFT89032.1 Uncharacterized conserved protein, contains FIST_N domain [Lishizhenia tianjinensis]
MISSQEFTLKDLHQCTEQKHQLVFVFGYREQFEKEFDFDLVRAKFPNAQIITTSTAGHIHENQFDENIVISAHHFEKSQIKAFAKNAKVEGKEVSKRLISEIPKENLKGLLIIADNTFGNSTDLINDLNEEYKGEINIFGGLAGNLDLKVPSISGLNEAPHENNVIAVGFYGESLTIKTNKVITAKGFGLDYMVSDYDRNVLIGLNGKPAYEVMYKLLGAESEKHFEEKIMLYPFLVKTKNRTKFVRSPIGVDHNTKTLIYGGDFRLGDKVQLTRSDIIEGLEETEEEASFLGKHKPQMVFLTSCYGRRIFLNELIHDEVTSLHRGFGENIKLTGFYSYAEFLTEANNNNACEIHNNSIALVAFTE